MPSYTGRAGRLESLSRAMSSESSRVELSVTLQCLQNLLLSVPDFEQLLLFKKKKASVSSASH